MQPDLVSIMMPAYNAGKYIQQAVESVLAQEYPGWELIVVDDGSTDQTADLLRGYSDPRITIVRQANGGEASARNAALKHVRGEFLAFLDADDRFLPGHVAGALAALRAHAGAGGVYTDGYYTYPEGTSLYPLSFRRRGPFEGDIFEQVIRASDVFGPPGCVVIRTERLRNLSFDESLTIGTDWDFWARFSEENEFTYSPSRLYLYRTHPDNLTSSVKKETLLLDTAYCRKKFIHMRRFNACSLEVREFLFYDLLVNLPATLAEQQEIVRWPEFEKLPGRSKARLFRLMSSRAILTGGGSAEILPWLREAGRQNRIDPRARGLSLLYRVHPDACRALLSLRRHGIWSRSGQMS